MTFRKVGDKAPARQEPAELLPGSAPPCEGADLLGWIRKKATRTVKKADVRYKPARLASFAARKGGEYVTERGEHHYKEKDVVNNSNGTTRTLEYHVTEREWDVWRCP